MVHNAIQTGLNWGELLSPLLEAALRLLITLLAGLVATHVAVVLPKLRRQYEQSLTASQRQAIESVVRIGVTMAEQMWADPSMRKMWAGKKQLAWAYIDKVLGQKGITVTAEEVEAMIESAVYTEINKAKVPPVGGLATLKEPEALTPVPTEQPLDWSKVTKAPEKDAQPGSNAVESSEWQIASSDLGKALRVATDDV